MAGQRRQLLGACALVVWVAGASVHAQLGAGALSGRLIDQAGSAVQGTSLTATEVGTGLTRTAVAGTDGAGDPRVVQLTLKFLF